MKSYAQGRLSDGQAESALQYLVLLRSWSPDKLFKIKCLACHGNAFRRTLRSEDDWQRIINRISRFNGFFLTRMQAESILEHIRTSPLLDPSEQPSTGAGDPQDAMRVLYETRCVQCHTLDIILLPQIPDSAWVDILIRMGEKSPWLISAQEALEMEPWILSMRRDPNRFRHEVPHQTRSLFFGKETP